MRLPVFYSDRMVAAVDSYSPSAAKPRAVVQSWLAIDPDLEVIEPTPVTTDQLSAAHDPVFVQNVMAGVAQNGFGNRSQEVAASLPFTSGAMLSACRSAIANGRVAIAPVSGFHHARHASAAGFCTFNGLMVSAMALRAEADTCRIGIFDADMHYGDGTDDIIRRLGLHWVQHYTVGRHFGEVDEAGTFLARLPKLLAQFEGCSVLIYQAGADPHIDDPLGGWLTTDQLRRRDRIVFEHCKTHGLPVAWNLAGGYQQPLRKVLDIHDNTLIECRAVYGVVTGVRVGPTPDRAPAGCR